MKDSEEERGESARGRVWRRRCRSVKDRKKRKKKTKCGGGGVGEVGGGSGRGGDGVITIRTFGKKSTKK